MSKYISGDIVDGEQLERVAKLKEKDTIELTVDKPLAIKYESSAWEIKREYKKSLRIFKPKNFDEIFEDNIWILFKKMGFSKMNKDRNFKVGVGTNQKQIDVFAKDDKQIILVECKTAERPTNKDLTKDIRDILHLKKGIIEALKEHYKEYCRCSFFLVTKNLLLTQKTYDLANENRSKDFFLWDDKETRTYSELAKQLGKHSRVVMYSNLFSKRKVLKPVKVPAIRGGKGDNKYYYFIIQPSKLLNGVAYIHRREERNPKDVMYTYQRMLNKSKLEKIRSYIQKGGFFANNIIMNFSSKPKWEKKGKIGDIVLGELTFPKHYGSAWLIDGQHRLYGYLNSGKSEDAYIPVLAFDNIAIKDQAKLFVDINKEQKPVSAALLWDLYADLYADSTDKKQQELRAISIVVKRLNSDKNSPISGLVKLPSISKDIQKKVHLTLTRLCVAIKENRLLQDSENLLFDENYEKTIDTAFEVISEYLTTISEMFPEDWERKEKGLLCSNVGLRILFNILRQLLRYLNYQESRNIYLTTKRERFNEKTKEILNPVIKQINDMTPEERADIRGATNREKIVENTQKLLWQLKNDNNFGIELWRKGGWEPGIPKSEDDKNIRDLINDTEIEMKEFIVQELSMLFGDEWWDKGVPNNIKDYVKRIIQKDASLSSYRKDLLSSVPKNERLRFVSTSHLKDLIIKRKNWEQFERYFAKDKEIISTAFRFYENLRNKYKHPDRIKDLDDVEKGLGYWNMRWLRKSIGLDDIKI